MKVLHNGKEVFGTFCTNYNGAEFDGTAEILGYDQWNHNVIILQVYIKEDEDGKHKGLSEIIKAMDNIVAVLNKQKGGPT